MWAFAMCVCVFATLLIGYPVAFTLAGVALAFAAVGTLAGAFDPSFLEAFPNRVFGIVTNETLLAVPLFIAMGVLLERAGIAERLLRALASLTGRLPGGLGLAVLGVASLLAASTGIVGATVVTLGLLALPTMLAAGYGRSLSAGLICASGTLGQIIPPSIVLILLGDVLSNAYQQAQLEQGIFSGRAVSVGDLFAGALVPGLLLVAFYALWLLWVSYRQPSQVPTVRQPAIAISELVAALLVPLLLILLVLGSILLGYATATEAAAIGAVGALILAAMVGRISLAELDGSLRSAVAISAMVFMILIAAAIFSLVFRGFGGDALVQNALASLPGGRWTALVVVMLSMLTLGFVLDFIEIIFVVVPLVAPPLLIMGFDPIWLGVMIALNLQTSFLTPPFGFALFYFRGVAPKSVSTGEIYRGVIPFIVFQLALLFLIAVIQPLATWLPAQLR